MHVTTKWSCRWRGYPKALGWISEEQCRIRTLNSDAVEVLNRQIGKHPARVFTFRGNPIAWANTQAWREALKLARIEDFWWHYLRHTRAIWLARQGTPLNVLRELGGWESESMVRRYA